MRSTLLSSAVVFSLSLGLCSFALGQGMGGGGMGGGGAMGGGGLGGGGMGGGGGSTGNSFNSSGSNFPITRSASAFVGSTAQAVSGLTNTSGATTNPYNSTTGARSGMGATGAMGAYGGSSSMGGYGSSAYGSSGAYGSSSRSGTSVPLVYGFVSPQGAGGGGLNSIPVQAAKILYSTATMDPFGVTLAEKLEGSKRVAFQSPPKVLVRGGVVVLLGEVASEHDRVLAEEYLRLDPSVGEVENMLTLAGAATTFVAPSVAPAVTAAEKPLRQPASPSPSRSTVPSLPPQNEGWRSSAVQGG